MQETDHGHLYEDIVKSFNQDPESPIVCYRKNHRNFYLIIFGLVLVMLLFATYSLIRIKRLSKVVVKTNQELEKSHSELELLHGELESSLDYAKNIHDVILPEADLRKYLPESFAFHSSSQKIGGDFYWCSECDGKIIVAVIDCTGHGVPGALISMISYNLILESVEETEIFCPKQILENLNEKFNRIFNQSKAVNDGMDISMCVIDPKERLMKFSGAGNPIYMVSGGELAEVKGVSQGIGSDTLRGKPDYEVHLLPYDKEATYYLFSDGYADQFGGEKDKKLGRKRMKALLTELDLQSVEEKEKQIKNYLRQWQGDRPQTDDITLVGYKLP